VSGTTVVELLRHAGAEPRDEWPDPDLRRPLDETGHAQAAALGDALPGDPAITAIVSSPALRCLQTVEPLSRAIGVPVHEDARLAEIAEPPVTDRGDAWVEAAWKGGRALRLVTELVASHAGERVVLCTHGDVVPATMALLAGRDGLDLSDVRCRKGGRFTLTFDGDRCIDAVAVRPPSPVP
jgi:8-oxo-dGTP diphosphatase